MADELEPANDNCSAGNYAGAASHEEVDVAIMSLARLLGRQIAREHFEAMQAANENRAAPGDQETSEGERGGGG